MTERAAPLVLALALALLALPLTATADAQPAGKAYRIGVIANAFDTADGPLFEVFLDGLRALGYVEDRNIIIDWRSSEGNFARLPGLAASLVRAKVDIMMAMSLHPARAAAEATKTIPIVFVVVADPVAQKLVGNPARPGGNITGLAAYGPEDSSHKVIQLLKEANPKIGRLAVLTNPANPVHQEIMSQSLPSAARRLHVSVLPLELRSASDIQGAFDRAVRERADALYVLGDVLTFIHRGRIADLAAKSRLPAIYAARGGVDAGGLMSYGPNPRDLYRRAAAYVDKILKGTSPGDLPVGQLAKSSLVINLKTAKAIGLTVPHSLLQRADEVIQ
jgi:ABC-type uncharacterized transport system substrate-binding protein